MATQIVSETLVEKNIYGYGRWVALKLKYCGKFGKRPPGEEMNLRKEKTVITIENYRRTTVHQSRIAVNGWCGDCELIGQLISPNDAAALLQTTVRDIFRLIEAGELHYSEMTSDVLLVCRNSCHFLRQRGSTAGG